MKFTPTGQFEHRVQLQKLKDPPDKSETGELIKEYVFYAFAWAAFRTLSGAERIAAQQVNATQTHEIKIRYRPGVKPDYRLVMGLRIFDIKDARNIDEANKEIWMRCTEVAT